MKNLIAACRRIGDRKTLHDCGVWIGAMDCFDNERWAHDWLEEMMSNVSDYSIELQGAGELAIRAVFPNKDDREYEPKDGLFSDFAAILEAYLEVADDGAWRLNFQIENILR